MLLHLGIKSIAIAADVSRPEDVQRMLATIVDKWGTVHIACNNAGINMNSPSEATSLEEWDKTFNVNLRGLFLCCQVSIGPCNALHKTCSPFLSVQNNIYQIFGSTILTTLQGSSNNNLPKLYLLRCFLMEVTVYLVIELPGSQFFFVHN